MENMGFTAACLKFFGKKQGQTNTEFMVEMRQLTDQDKDELAEMFKTVGYNIVPSTH